VIDSTESDGSSVRINRLKDGYSWVVTVAAGDSSAEALQVAKDRALVLTRQLESELMTVKLKETEALPF
jgi:hypothetical protein